MNQYQAVRLVCCILSVSSCATDETASPSRSTPTTEARGSYESNTTDTISTDNAGSADGGSLMPPPPDCAAVAASSFDRDAQALFDFPKVPHFDFHLPPEQWESLKQNAQEEQYASAQLCFEGQYVGTVGLRFKGYYGSLFGCFDEQGKQTCPRLSMKVKFDEYVVDQRFFRLKRLNFNAYRHDDSRIKEKLVYDLYRSVGVVAPRAAWAVLRVNGETQGLYGMVEQVDGRFTSNRWPDTPDGNLYKELWPTQTDSERVSERLSTNEEKGDVAGFVAFARAMTAASETDLPARLAEFMNTEYLVRYMAVDDAVANYDGVTYFWTDGVERNNHNFYIYEQTPNAYTLVPWDVEASFWINPDHAAPHWTTLPGDCSLTYPYWEGQASAPGCDPLFRALHAHVPAWREASQQLLDGPFALDVMQATIDSHAAFIADEAHADPTPIMYTTFDDAVTFLRSSVVDLRGRLELLIAP
jgi:hypothetical protein